MATNSALDYLEEQRKKRNQQPSQVAAASIKAKVAESKGEPSDALNYLMEQRKKRPTVQPTQQAQPTPAPVKQPSFIDKVKTGITNLAEMAGLKKKEPNIPSVQVPGGIKVDGQTSTVTGSSASITPGIKVENPFDSIINQIDPKITAAIGGTAKTVVQNYLKTDPGFVGNLARGVEGVKISNELLKKTKYGQQISTPEGRQVARQQAKAEIEAARRPIKADYKEPGLFGGMVEELKLSTANLIGSVFGSSEEMTGTMTNNLLSTAIGMKIKKEADKMIAANPEWKAPENQQWGPDKVGRLVAGAAPSLLGAIAAGMTTGPAGLFLFGVAGEGGSTYGEAIDAGTPEGKAQLYGMFVGVVNGTLEMIFPDGLLKPGLQAARKTITKEVTNDLLAKVLKSGAKFTVNGLKEGVPETLQQLVSNSVAMNYDKNRKLWDGLLESFVGGSLTGGLAGHLEGKVFYPQQIRDMRTEIIDKVPGVKEEIKLQQELGYDEETAIQTAIDKASVENPEAVRQIVSEVKAKNIEAKPVEKQLEVVTALENADISEKKKEKPLEAQNRAIIDKLASSVDKISEQIGELKYTPATNLSTENKTIESNFAKQIGENFADSESKYTKMFGNILNTDNARELSLDYVANRSEKSVAVHEPASAFIRQLYEKQLKQDAPAGKYNEVLFTAGGTGAGKTTAINTKPEYKASADKAQIVYDTNLSNYESSVQKVEQALAADKKVKIVYVLRDPVSAMFEGAVPRAVRMGRTVPIEVHIDTHVQSLETVKKLAAKYGNNDNVSIGIIDNNSGRGKQKSIDIAKLDTVSYNKAEIRKQINEKIDQLYKSKQISEKIYKGFKGDTETIQVEGKKGIGRNGEKPKEKYNGVSETAYKNTIANGGVTINLEGDLPNKGIAFSPYKDTETIIDADKFSQDDVTNFMVKHADKLSQPGNHMGAWENEGKIYLDISQVGDKNSKTLQNAIDAKQLAAFDLENFTEVPLGKIENGKYNQLYEATNHPYLNQKQEAIPSVPGAKEEPGKVQDSGKTTGEITQKERVAAAKAPIEETTGKPKLSRVAERVLDKLVDVKHSDVTYQPLNIVQDAAKASEFVAQNPELAEKIAKGLELPPPDITETAISIAMAEKARQDNDFKLYSDLIVSRTFRQTRRGQEIVVERGRMDENSSEFFIRKLLDERARIVAKGKRWLFAKEAKIQEVIKKEVTQLKQAVDKKVIRKLESAQKLIDSLTCKI